MSSRKRIVQVDRVGRVISDVNIYSVDNVITLTDHADVYEVTKDVAAQDGRMVGMTLDATLEDTLGVTRKVVEPAPEPVKRARVKV